MAAPQIPNLLAARGSNSTGPRRDRSRGGGRPPYGNGDEDPEIVKARNDKIVQGTDVDASVSRMSAVRVGYLDDPFAKEFAAVDGPRRFPIINRGTYVRTRAIDLLVEEFLYAQPSTLKQIISLGAGSDTRFFRLMSRAPPPNVLYHELDFPTNSALKIATIHASPALRALTGDARFNLATDTELHTPNYHIHALDLRTLDRAHARTPGPGKLDHIDPALPTLLISECCLTYLAPDTADAVVKHFVALLAPTTPVALVLYEPINPFDSFGKVMVRNLAARGIVMQTMERYHGLGAQRARMREYGFVDGGGAVDVDFLYEAWVDEDEKKRVGGLEMLDEVEELNLLAKHYCVAWGFREGREGGERGSREMGGKKEKGSGERERG